MSESSRYGMSAPQIRKFNNIIFNAIIDLLFVAVNLAEYFYMDAGEQIKLSFILHARIYRN